MTRVETPTTSRARFSAPCAPHLRLAAVTDAVGQVTTLTYGLSSDPLKVTLVTDPFGRTAQLEYDAAGRLTAITDTIGLRSSFTYGGTT